PGPLPRRGREGAAAEGGRRHHLRLGGRGRVREPGRVHQPAPAEVQDRSGRQTLGRPAHRRVRARRASGRRM
ncbi:MAG: hypothetical protein AVDCRST_MAG91-3760, partial [uncultured Sphingomonadaceae bacterium]